jgi:predicted nucleic acid-binding protein
VTAVLLDTSAWVEYLRDTGSRTCEEVERLLLDDAAEVCTTPPVVMELLAGATSETAHAQLELLTAALPRLAIDGDVDFAAAAAVYRTLRRGGTTARGLLDCLIAVVAARHDVELVHRDADLARVAQALPRLVAVDLR